MPATSIEVATDPPYSVEIGPDVLAAFPDHHCQALIADREVLRLHGEKLPFLAQVPLLELEGGEGAKTFDGLRDALEFLTAAGLSRESTVVTFGGGSILDLGGLAAALYKRGTWLVHCPTTLLAQVDASVGGKTAINLEAGKNLVGTFHQPARVYADVGVLTTLSDSEWASGLGEVAKSALLGGEEELTQLEELVPALMERDPDATAAIVRSCVRVKADIVALDPTERGPRRALNLGHTFGHAIEHTAGYGKIPHGVAVATGIALALEASTLWGECEPDLVERVNVLLGRLGLPTGLDALRASTGLALDADDLVASMMHDKKGAVGEPELVLLKRPGVPTIDVPADEEMLRDVLV